MMWIFLICLLEVLSKIELLDEVVYNGYHYISLILGTVEKM